MLSGFVSLPCQPEMLEDIQLKRARVASKYVSSQRHTIQVNIISVTPIAEAIATDSHIQGFIQGGEDKTFCFMVVTLNMCMNVTVCG